MKPVPHQHAFLCNLSKLIQFIDNTGIMVTAGELKTPLIIELNFFINGQLTYDIDKIRPYGIFWKNLDPLNRWGGDLKAREGKVDMGHFERHI